jgi:hypothetical protein
MSRRIILLAVTAVAALAAMALPAIAAAAPEMDFTKEPTEANPVVSTGESGVSRLVSVGGSEVECTSSHVKVTWTSKTTGHLHVLFTGCKSSGFSCNSTGLSSGEITTNTPFHLIYIEGFTKTVGVLATPPAGGTFADFHCTFFVHVVVTGNGLVGHVDSPACGGTSRSSTVSFEQSATGVQKYKKVGGTTYHLESSFNGGTAEESSEVASGSTTLEGAVEGTLTCN